MPDPRFRPGDRVRVRRNRKAVGTVEHVTTYESWGFPELYKVRFGHRTCRHYEAHEIEPADPQDFRKGIC